MVVGCKSPLIAGIDFFTKCEDKRQCSGMLPTKAVPVGCVQGNRLTHLGVGIAIHSKWLGLVALRLFIQAVGQYGPIIYTVGRFAIAYRPAYR